MSDYTTLKPCPFCGGDVYPCYTSKEDCHYIVHYARNRKKCCVQTIVLSKNVRTLAQAIDAWNRRADDDTVV